MSTYTVYRSVDGRPQRRFAWGIKTKRRAVKIAQDKHCQVVRDEGGEDAVYEIVRKP